jgi:HEAT repeat protein
MYMMPRSFPQSKKQFAALSVLVLLMLVFTTSLDASAQKRRKRPATGSPATQQQGAANTSTPQQKPQQKKITPLRSSDTADGSRITIRADAPLNDYSAYRSGDRYYVVIPEASAPAAQGGMKGRGFEDVQVQKRGTDTILSFKLQPGTNARVSQKFDKLDVELTTPGRQGANVPTTTGKNVTPPATVPTTQPTPRPTPATPQTTPATGISGQTTNPPLPVSPGGNNPTINPPLAGGNPTVVYPPTPKVAASPSVSPEANPAQTPSVEEVAQAQPPPTTQPITTSAPASSGSSLGAVLQQNWLIILIGALVLASLVMIVAARSRAQRTATTPARRTRREKKRAASEKAAEELPEPDTASAVTAASSATAVAAARPEIDVEAVAAGVVATEGVLAAEGARTVEAEETPVAVAEEETKEIEVAPAVDAERIDTEVRNVLAGESYDESVVGASDAGTRQLVATELLSALAARNVERRERAREAFIKHDYLDEATKNLRTAHAPAERAAAARALGYVKDKSATPHLIAALEDEAPEVRRASVEALADLREPSAAEPLQALLARERDRKVPKNLIKGAIEASTIIEEEETPTLEAETPSVTEAALAHAEMASELVAVAAPSVIEEVETVEDERAARERAEEEEARQRAEEEERKRVEERLRVEEESRQQAEAQRLAEEEVQRQAEEERLRLEAVVKQRAEEEARRQAEEEAAKLRAEEEARRREEEERRQAVEAARLKAEEEAARQRAVEEAARGQAEADRQAEAERLRLEEVFRQRLQAEAAQRRAEEETARLRAEEEARRRAEEEARLVAEEETRRRAEEARLAAEAEAQRRAEEEARRLAAEESSATLNAEAILPFDHEVSDEALTIESSAVTPVEPFIERNDGTDSGWVEVEMSDAEFVHQAESPHPASPAEEATMQSPMSMESQAAEPAMQQIKEIEPSSYAIVEEPAAAQPGTKEIDYTVTERGIANLDEFSTVPGVILKRLSSEEPTERAAAVADLARVGGEDSFREISAAFDDPAVEVRNAAVRSLFDLNSDRAATFTRALREAPPERRRKIGAALASSGLASEAIGQLMGESREKTYDAFSLLFLMSKAGEVQPLMRAIEEHPNNEVRLAVVKLLALSGQQEILPAFRRLAVRGSLPTEVRSAVMEAIYQISSQSPTPA